MSEKEIEVYEKIYTAWTFADRNGLKEVKFALGAILREMAYNGGWGFYNVH